MDRRSALKNLTLSIGYAVTAPTLFNMLSSCTADTATWTPVFLSKQEQHLVTHLVDIILPTSTELPGALDVNVPQFIDIMYKDIETEAKQKLFQNGATTFAVQFEKMFKKEALKGSKEEIQELFASYFDLPKKEIQNVLEGQRVPEKNVSDSNKDNYLAYKFLFSVRSYALYGYFTSEKVGEEVLAYDPIPGVYESCVSLEETTGGRAWSL